MTIGSLRLNFGFDDLYKIGTEFSDLGPGIRPGGSLLDPQVIEVPPVVVTGTRPMLLSDAPFDFSMPNNELTRLLGVAPGPDATKVAMREIWQDPNASLGAKMSAGTMLTGLNMRDFVVSAPINFIHGLGSNFTTGLDSAYRLIADLGGPHSDAAWESKILAPAARIGDQLTSAGEGVVRQFSTFTDAAPMQRREMVWKGVDGLGALVDSSTASIRNDWNQGNAGALASKAALAAATLYGGYRGAVGGPLFGATVDKALVALDRVQNTIAEPFGRTLYRPWGDLSLERIHTSPQIRGQLVEPGDGGSPIVRNWMIGRPDPIPHSPWTTADELALGLPQQRPNIQLPEGQRLFKIDITDPNLSNLPVGSARLEPNWNGLGNDYVWARQRFGLRPDGMAMPNVPEGTARLSDVYSLPIAPGGGRNAVQLSFQLAEELGQKHIVGMTRSPFVLQRFASYDAPGPFNVTHTHVPFNAADNVWNHWLKQVDPAARISPTWSQAAAKGQDRLLLGMAERNPALNEINQATGMTPFENMKHNFSVLRAGADPVIELRHLPMEDKLLLPANTLRFGFQWDVNTPLMHQFNRGLQSLYQAEAHGGFRN